MNLKQTFAASAIAAALFAATSASAGHVAETLTLARGWNAVYLESTPEQPDPAAFFAGSPVERVGLYLPDAYDATAQYRGDGTEILQQPVSFQTWMSDAPARVCTLTALRGGHCYLIYSSAAFTKTFYGTPAVPDLAWRVADTSGEGFMTIAAPSLAAGTSVAAKAYFGEGPFGAGGTAYTVGGTGQEPTFLSLGFLGGKASVEAGKAYAFTGVDAGDWPGVIDVSGLTPLGVYFGETDNTALFFLRNAGTADRTFRLSVLASEKEGDQPLEVSRLVSGGPADGGSWTNAPYGASWELEVRAGDRVTVKLAVDRAGVTDPTAYYGALLQIEDLGGTRMRVRLPIVAEAARTTGSAAAWPAGLWLGGIELTQVSQLGDTTPVDANGTMKAMLILHVAENGQLTLLQRAVVATEAGPDGEPIETLYVDAGDAPAGALSSRRVESVMLSATTPAVHPAETDSDQFGQRPVFTYTVAADARDNPFRHAWHPDHQTGIAVTNTVSLLWRDENGAPFFEEATGDGASGGVVEWRMEGLAKDPVVARGVFGLKRVAAIPEIEK